MKGFSVGQENVLEDESGLRRKELSTRKRHWMSLGGRGWLAAHCTMWTTNLEKRQKMDPSFQGGERDGETDPRSLYRDSARRYCGFSQTQERSSCQPWTLGDIAGSL